MKIFPSAIFCIAIISSVASADLIVDGSNLQDANAAMQELGYSAGGLAMVHVDQIPGFLDLPEKKREELESLQIWRLDQGYLLISYVVSTEVITNLTFYLSDERPKAVRKEFQFHVISFNPETEEMLLATHNQNKENKAEMATPRKPSD